MSAFQLPLPHLLVVVGLPGAGKTFFAEKFTDGFKVPYIDFDFFREVANSEDIGDQLAGHTLAQMTRTKQTIVVEGRGSTKADRKDLMDAAHKAGYATLFVWVQTEPATTEQRSVYGKTATMTLDQYVELSRGFENLSPKEPHVVISGKHTSLSQAKTVLKKLVNARPPMSPPPARPVSAASTRQTPRPQSGRGRINIG